MRRNRPATVRYDTITMPGHHSWMFGCSDPRRGVRPPPQPPGGSFNQGVVLLRFLALIIGLATVAVLTIAILLNYALGFASLLP